MRPTVPAGDPELDLKPLLADLHRNRRTIQRTTGAFFFLALLYVLFSPRTYQAVTTVKLPESNDSAANAIREMAFLPTSGDPVETYMEIAGSDKVAAGVVDLLQLRSKPELKKLSDLRLVWVVKSQVKIDNLRNSDVLSIHARARTGQEAADLANAWAQSFIKVNLDLSRQGEEERYQFIHGQLQAIRDKLSAERESKQNLLNPTNEVETDEEVYKSLLEQDQEAKIRANNQNTGIVVVDEAVAADRPVAPKTFLSLFLGLFAGFSLGVVAAFVKTRREDRVHGAHEIDPLAQAPCWAEIPAVKAGGDRDPGSFLRDPDYLRALKGLRARLLLALAPESRALGVLSAGPGEGKSFLTAALGILLAQSGKKVLLVDTALDHPALDRLFGLESGGAAGLSRFLAGQSKLGEAIKPSGTENLMILPAGARRDLSELLGSAQLGKTIGEMKQKFDFVIFDTAALLDSSDTAVLASLLDGVLLVARYGTTSRSDVQQAVLQVRTARVPLWGTVVNAVRIEPGPLWDLLGLRDLLYSKFSQRLGTALRNTKLPKAFQKKSSRP